MSPFDGTNGANFLSINSLEVLSRRKADRESDRTSQSATVAMEMRPGAIKENYETSQFQS
jgi:hypothetical protein